MIWRKLMAALRERADRKRETEARRASEQREREEEIAKYGCYAEGRDQWPG